MDALTRQEYPAMLECLPPAVAVAKLNDRVKKITKVNLEIADWLQERRKIEEAYATSLRKLSKRQLNDVWGHMGVFEKPWNQMMTATEDIAKSHNYFANCIEKDVELPLRNFATTNEEISNVTTMRGNLSSLARELEDAQNKNDRLIRKGGKASVHRVEAASNRHQAAKQQWDLQAAFVFESLQALDERRVNHLRDILTQYQTHEADHIQLNREAVESTLKFLIEISTETEIRNWSQTDGVRKNTFKRKGLSGADTSIVTEPIPSLGHDDNLSDQILPPKAESGEIKKLQRMGTLLTRRRKSVRSVFRSASPSLKNNGFQPFGRDGNNRKSGLQSPSRLPTSYATESDPRLFPLPESPLPQSLNKNTDGNKQDANLNVSLPPRKSSLSPTRSESPSKTTDTANGESSSEAPPISNTTESQVDEGYSVPPTANDPISRALEEASQDNQQQFKLSIRKDPIQEQELDAEAALSNVTNTLRSSQITPHVRKTGTFRGRRDVRNTMSIRTGDSLSPAPEHAPPMKSTPSSPTATASVKAPTLSKNPSIEKFPSLPLDNASIRSGKSWKNQVPARHPEMHNPGLNCSIIETVSCSFNGENPISTSINGEIAFTYNLCKNINVEQSMALDHETIKIYDISNLEMILPNKSLAQPVSSECKDHFLINLSLISSKILIGFTYRIHSPDIWKTHLPLLIKSTWKNQANKLGLVLEYSLNPAFSSTQVSFTNLILIAHYTNISASSCQTKPSGIHLKDKNLVYWRLGDVTLDGAWHKTVARFSGTESMAPEPGHIEAKWELNASEELQLSQPSLNIISGGVVIKRLQEDARSNTNDQFADMPIEAIKSSINTAKTNGVEEQSWIDIPTSKKLVSGKYVTK
ncbi:putative saff domain-containing protein [Erysiphe neolycopersici]|uniref:Putative saff domain-containing protein n=1 Tax=Erysiphe neolycopersici TaxID=212602 RepID=A0A420HGY6_9PEZI|nr:putative saff domain-containing protein [Erysiphe neolycopersici]